MMTQYIKKEGWYQSVVFLRACIFLVYVGMCMCGSYTASAAPSVSLSFSDETVPYNGSSFVSWSASGDATYCTLSPVGITTLTGLSHNSSLGVSGVTSPVTYTFSCQDAGGNWSSVADTLNVTYVPPEAYLSVNGGGGVTVSPGDWITYSWNSARGQSFSSSYTSDYCGSGSFIANDPAGSGGPYQIAHWQAGCTYYVTYTVSNGAGSANSTVTVSIPPPPPPPTASIGWGTNPVAYNGNSTVTWSASNATYCDFYINGVYSGNTSNGWPMNNSGGWTYGITAPMSFGINCSNAAGVWTGIQTATVNVIPPSPGSISGSCDTAGNVALNWPAASQATYYSLRVDNTSTGGWSGSCSGGGDFCADTGATSYNFTGTQGHSYSAWVHACNTSGCSSNPVTTFSCPVPTYTLTVTSAGNGTAGGGGVYSSGQVVTLTNTPNAGYAFSHWSGDLDCADGSVTMNATKSCTANFTSISYTYTFNGNGATVAPSPASVTQPQGSALTPPTAPSRTGYAFTGWSPTIPATMPIGGGTSNAQWTLTTHTLTTTNNQSVTSPLSSSPGGIACGSTCSAPFDYGTIVTISAPARAGHTVTLTGGCTASGAVGFGASCPVTMTADTSVTATYALGTENLTVINNLGEALVTAVPDGSPVLSCGSTCASAYTFGTLVTVTAPAQAGRSVTLSGGCSASGAPGAQAACTVSMTEARTVIVTYTAQPDLSVVNLTPVSNAWYRSDAIVTFTGRVDNSAAQSVVEGGWGDVDIDWNSDGSFTNYNAYAGNQLGGFALSETKSLLYAHSNPPVGVHRYRFTVDTTNLVTESDETNNQSSWVTFTILSGDVNSTPTTVTYGGTTTVSWITDGTTGLGCTVSGGSDSWDIDSNSSPQVSSPLSGSTVYSLVCGGILLDSVVVQVVVIPEITISDLDRTVERGKNITLSWDTKGQNCTLTGIGPVGPGTGNAVGAQNVVVLARTEYVLACPSESVSETVEIIQTIFES